MANDALRSFYSETGVNDFNGFLQKIGIDDNTISKISSFFTDPTQIQDLIAQMNLGDPDKLLQYLHENTDLDEDTIASFMRESGLQSDDVEYEVIGSGCTKIMISIYLMIFCILL